MIVLLSRSRTGMRNEKGFHAAVVSSSDVAAARDALAAKLPTVKGLGDFDALVLDADGTFEDGIDPVQLFEADCPSQRGLTRGGNRFPPS